jgi:mannosyl-oligosaccharide alpha-1,2-mannosidase
VFTELLSSGTIERDQSAVLAEIGSFQLEYTYLAKLTGKKKFYDHVRANNIAESHHSSLAF